IGGNTAGARNIISGNGGSGVNPSRGSHDNSILGNFIGTNVTGNAAVANAVGVYIVDSPNNLVGGTVAGSRNVISGNTFAAVSVEGAAATGNLVQGNFLGTDFTGIVALPNHDGIGLRAANNVIGGTVPVARNVMSGNINVGIYLSTGATGNQVMGNFIGTDVTGTAKVSNLQH